MYDDFPGGIGPFPPETAPTAEVNILPQRVRIASDDSTSETQLLEAVELTVKANPLLGSVTSDTTGTGASSSRNLAESVGVNAVPTPNPEETTPPIAVDKTATSIPIRPEKKARASPPSHVVNGDSSGTWIQSK